MKAVQVVGPGEQPRSRESARNAQALQARRCEWKDVDAVAVIVEGNFVEQCWADRVGGVNNGAVGRIPKSVSDGWHVCAVPLADGVTLRNLLGDKVTEHGKLACEIMVDTDDLFLQIGWGCRGGIERVSRRRCRKNTSSEQCLSIAAQQRCWNLVARKRL